MEKIHTNSAPAAVGPYSQAIDTGSLVFLSGQIGIDPAVGKITGTTVVEQAEQVCKNVGAVLAAAGLGYANVVKTTVFLKDIADFPVVNQVYAKYFESLPARSCCAVASLPAGALVEVEAIAAR